MGPRVLAYNSDAVKTCESFTQRKKNVAFSIQAVFQVRKFQQNSAHKNQPIRHPVPQIPPPPPIVEVVKRGGFPAQLPI